MYDTFYKLAMDPFCLSPDHRFCYRHRSFAKARAYLYFALQRAEGFVMITGAPGTGKTTLLNQLLSEAHVARFTVARLNTTQLGASDLLQMTAYAFRQNGEGRSKAQQLHQLEIFLQQQHRTKRRAVLIVDEAQDLSFDALEEVRLLTNLELDGRPLLQVLLIGQDQLQEKICAPELMQLQQRMIAHAHLEPMNADESAAYVTHRLRVAGWSGDPEIDDDAIREIFVFSHGVPRRVNQICSRLFLYGMVDEKHLLGVADVRHVIGELHEERLLLSEDEGLLAMRTDPALHVSRNAAYVERVRESPAVSPLFESAQGSQILGGHPHNMAEIAPDRFGSDRDGVRGNAASHRIEVARINSNMAPRAVSASHVHNSRLAVAHKIDVLPAHAENVPAVRRAAQVHELRPSRPNVSTLASSAPDLKLADTADTEMNSRARYLRQSRRQRVYAFLLSVFVLGAALYTARLDIADVPPTSATAMQTTDGDAALTSRNEIAPSAPVLPSVKPRTFEQEIGERLQRRALSIERSSGGYVIDPGDGATFGFRSAAINDALRDVLDRIVDALHDVRAVHIRVIGHADVVGSANVNRDISQDRALNVMKYFARHGIPPQRLQAEARGAEQLKSAQEQHRNRRVEIFIEPQIDADR